jgi:hypothetical protein
MRASYDPTETRSSWPSILKFLYLWSILAIIVWSPVYSSADKGGFIVPVYGHPESRETGMPSLLKLGDRFDFALESKNYQTDITFEVADGIEGGFRIHSTYRQKRKLTPVTDGNEMVRPRPIQPREDWFSVDRQGVPIGQTYTSGYWIQTWGAQHNATKNSEEFVH